MKMSRVERNVSVIVERGDYNPAAFQGQRFGSLAKLHRQAHERDERGITSDEGFEE